jgi:DNA-binding response OmpR family regulator
VPKLDNLQQEWTKYRARLEREIRVLVVHDDPKVCEQLDQLLFRCRISSRTVDSLQHLEELVARDHYSLVLVAAHLPQMDDLALVQTLRDELSEVDLLPVLEEVNVDIVRKCIELGIQDVVNLPIHDGTASCARIQTAVRRNVDRRMRAHVLRRLREELARVDDETRKQVTNALERRLDRFKRWIGAFDRVLVEEGHDADMRRLSENLLVAGMNVESTELPDETHARIERGALHLAVVGRPPGSTDLAQRVEEMRWADPLVELVLVVAEPQPAEALAALRGGVALYEPWPPADYEQLVDRICSLQHRCRRARLLDALLTALFWESRGVLDHETSVDEAYATFRQLSGMEREMPASGAADMDVDPAFALDEVLDNIEDVSTPAPARPPTAELHPVTEGQERRAHPRISENQFVRFRADGAQTSILGYVGDISEGGLFVRTARLQTPGAQLSVDVNLEYEGLGYLLRCRGEVAWVARDTSRVPFGPGFGVKFLDPPEDVAVLLQRIVRSRSKP